VHTIHDDVQGIGKNGFVNVARRLEGPALLACSTGDENLILTPRDACRGDGRQPRRSQLRNEVAMASTLDILGAN